MALTSTAFKLAVIVSAVDKLSGPMSKMVKATAKVESSLLSLNRAGANLTKLGGAATLAGGAIAAGLTPAISKFIELQTGMAEVNTILGDSFKNMEGLSAGALEVFKKYPVELGKTTKGLFDLVSASVKPARALEALDLSARAALAGVTDIATTADIGTTIMNNYGIGVDGLEGIFDKLFLTVRKGKTTMGELGQFMGNLVPIAAAAHVEFNQVASAIAVMTAKGIKTDVATTALKNLISVIASQPERIRDIAGEMAFQAGKKGDLIGVLTEVAKRGTDLAKLQDIFPDIRSGLAAAALATDVDKWRVWNKEMANSRGEMTKAARIMEKTLGVRLKVLANRFDVLKISVGKGATPEIEKLGDVLNGFLITLESNNEGLEKFGATAAKFAKILLVLGGSFIAVGSGLKIFAFISANVIKLGAALKFMIPVLQTVAWLTKGLFVILGGTGTIIVAGVAAAFFSLFTIINNWRQLMSTTGGELVGWLDDVFGPIGDAVMLAQDFWFKAGTGLIDAFTRGLERDWSRVVGFFSSGMDALGKYLPGSDAEKGALSKLTAAGRAIPKTLSTGIAASMPDLARQISSMTDKMAINLGLGGMDGMASPSGALTASAAGAGMAAPAALAAGGTTNNSFNITITINETGNARQTGESVKTQLGALFAELAVSN